MMRHINFSVDPGVRYFTGGPTISARASANEMVIYVYIEAWIIMEMNVKRFTLLIHMFFISLCNLAIRVFFDKKFL